MTDEEILALFRSRDETALRETERKYEGYCAAIAGNILHSPEDVQECLNDVFLQAWNAIPPEQPRILAHFLGKLTRDLAIDRWRRSNSKKRGGGQLSLALEELQDCISDGAALEDLVEQRALTETLQNFLQGLPPAERNVFLCRYWYLDPIPAIAERFQFSRSKVTSMLHRTRKKLHAYLKKGGYFDEQK